MKVREFLEQEFAKYNIKEFVPYTEFTADTLSPALNRFCGIMARPKSIVINGVNITIDYIEPIYQDLYDFSGCASYRLLEIKVIDYPKWKLTLWHELLHFCEYLSPITYFESEKVSITVERYLDNLVPNLEEVLRQLKND